MPRRSAIRSIKVQFTGTADLEEFFAGDDAVRPGYQGSAARSSASDEKLQQPGHACNAHCPALDLISNRVPGRLDLQPERTPALAAE